jgi:uncharacterized pyridoxal phosphate-containing UPF0001 family protein
LQIYIAKEETKFGLSEEEALSIMNDKTFPGLKNVSIVGVMGMATNTDNKDQIRNEFKNLKIFSDKLRTSYVTLQHTLNEISMGMSGDYKIAMEEGSTMIRVGSRIFGER